MGPELRSGEAPGVVSGTAAEHDGLAATSELGRHSLHASGSTVATTATTDADAIATHAATASSSTPRSVNRKASQAIRRCCDVRVVFDRLPVITGLWRSGAELLV